VTETETAQVCGMLIDQVGVKPDDVMKSLSLWKMNLLSIDYPKAQEALKILMMEGVSNKTAGKWLSSIIKHCGGSTQVANQQKLIDNNPGCVNCQFSGVIEVPHRSGWVDGRWNGMYTMVVACGCPAGQLKACQMMNLRSYEGMFPNWRDEHPRRRLEMQLRAMDNKEPPRAKIDLERHHGRIARIRSELDYLDGEVADFEANHA